MRVTTATLALCAALFVLAPASRAAAQQGMPDLSQMSGVPLPVADVPTGTVTVRVIRGSLANVIPGQTVEIVVNGESRTATTNDAGRAEFTGLKPGATVKASTVVDGGRLESQEFQLPAAGGIRLMLVAGLGQQAGAGGAAPAAPPQTATPGAVSFGDQTRFVFEMGDEALTGFYMLQVVNSTAGPVEPPAPVTVDLPEGAQGATLMQGSSPQGSVAGTKVVIAGPFAPGQTMVQVAFTLPFDGPSLTVAQQVPVPLPAITLLVEKVGDMQIQSPQILQHREIKAQADTYLLGQGGAVNAGDRVSFTISGLPHRATWPRDLALALAALVLVVGVWASARPVTAVAAEEARRQKLAVRRDKLFADLAGLEEQRGRGAVDQARYELRRAELVAALERIYVELGEDVAA